MPLTDSFGNDNSRNVLKKKTPFGVKYLGKLLGNLTLYSKNARNSKLKIDSLMSLVCIRWIFNIKILIYSHLVSENLTFVVLMVPKLLCYTDTGFKYNTHFPSVFFASYFFFAAFLPVLKKISIFFLFEVGYKFFT